MAFASSPPPPAEMHSALVREEEEEEVTGLREEARAAGLNRFTLPRMRTYAQDLYLATAAYWIFSWMTNRSSALW